MVMLRAINVELALSQLDLHFAFEEISQALLACRRSLCRDEHVHVKVGVKHLPKFHLLFGNHA